MFSIQFSIQLNMIFFFFFLANHFDKMIYEILDEKKKDFFKISRISTENYWFTDKDKPNKISTKCTKILWQNIIFFKKLKLIKLIFYIVFLFFFLGTI